MGSIFKQQYYVTVRGKRVKRESKKWYVSFKNAAGEWVREPAYTDKQASLHMLTRREKEVAMQREGFDDAMTAELARPIAEHLADYVQHLKDKRASDNHWKASRTRVERVLALGAIGKASEITKARVDAALAKLRAGEHGEPQVSTATANHYLQAVQSFAKWLKEENRATDNRIATMRKRRVEGERVKERRPLTEAEFNKLLEVTSEGPERLKLSGPDRVALYTLASFTGYRRDELSSITPKAFTFGETPALTVVRRYSKRDRPESIPLNKTIARFFERYLASRPGDEPIWKIGKSHTATMIQADMDAAGIAYKKGIETVDFHSLRQTFTAGLARSGAPVKVTQELARHSDVNLTMGVYAKMDDADRRAAVDNLPVPKHLTQALTQSRGHNVTSTVDNNSRFQAAKPRRTRKK